MNHQKYQVRAWRHAYRMKQEELARLSGKSIQTISAIERGGVARPRTIEAIARAFGLESPADLLGNPPGLSVISDAEIEDLACTGRIISIISKIAANDRREILPLLSALRRIPVQLRMI
ncbi:helix-turn-helix transcriptional regulator [Agrobacterium vitis]|uniref:helix-turn-helix domain-containing protein n=1 Tax=Rhizobium/Agrobacterium group TaxID=227290 RepID=UPI0012E81F06|nr:MULTISPECIES: helix-turn-helix domain-containing protein [Rhizobium/Agrobacterium group]MCF1446665.1 helix-turn-helix transcriptional regulator [Allorhizobium ampelinum]MCF1485043.1 helix-turn-helix transcriptional regulator [Allorhizobium ampelinum]MCF1492459.1 helix-turn-helix transcriptional regulator [Allorhizobium ampelinum]MVA44449.1 helix-turn-helix domain-containing protein [Agrobacterium vitis]NSZ53513.1 helix-turn-helix transcriptional regulator [Agrobacterium vitis]